MVADFASPSSDPIFSDDILEHETKLVKEIYLKVVMRDVIKGTFTGIGSGTGEFGPAQLHLLPSSVAHVRMPRLFARMSSDSDLWAEQVGWVSKMQDPNASVNEALKAAAPYCAGREAY